MTQSASDFFWRTLLFGASFPENLRKIVQKFVHLILEEGGEKVVFLFFDIYNCRGIR